MTHNDKKKLTFIDSWYRLYTKNARHRQHKSDKKEATRKMRAINKSMCVCVLRGSNLKKQQNLPS